MPAEAFQRTSIQPRLAKVLPGDRLAIGQASTAPKPPQPEPPGVVILQTGL
jgi:hypothetical protein